MEWEFNSYYTLIAATLVLLVGKFLVQKIKFLRDFNIPEPVAGGLVAAIVLFALHEAYGVSFKFEKPLQDAFMLIFFTSIGLSADFSRLKAGGLPLVIFTAVVGAFIIVQNFVGVGLASALGLDPLIGLITGSITLTGRARDPPPASPRRAAGRRPGRQGTCRAFGDRIPVPDGVERPRPHKNVPGRAGCPRPSRTPAGSTAPPAAPGADRGSAPDQATISPEKSFTASDKRFCTASANVS